MAADDPWSVARSVAASATLCADAGVDPSPVEGPRYESRGEIGSGGMGQVDVVRDRWLDRDVARKLVIGDGTEHRLAREALITARLDHPGIVGVLDTGVDEQGRRFYTMPLVRGRTLAKALQSRPPPIVRDLLGVANAVAFAHSMGVVHRDLKPDNIVLGRHGQAQVVDWGIAADHGSPGLPEGTVGWSDPKQLAGAQVDTRHDVYALGQCLAAILPEDAASDALAIVRQAKSGGYADADAFATDLAAWLDGRRVSAYDYSAGELMWRALVTLRGPLAVVAIVGAVLLVAGAWTFERTRSERDRAVVAEEDARTHLASLLSAQAVSAFIAGDRVQATRLASQCLDIIEDPASRGVLSALNTGEMELINTSAPPCATPQLLSDGTLACVDSAGVSLHTFSGNTLHIDHPNITELRATSDGWLAASDVVTPTSRGQKQHTSWLHQDGRVETFMSPPGGFDGSPQGLVVLHPHQAGLYFADGTRQLWDACPGGFAWTAPVMSDSGQMAWSCREYLAWGRPLQTEQQLPIADHPAAMSWWGDDLVVGTYRGTVALVKDGAFQWEISIPGGTPRQLQVIGDHAFIATERGAIRALHLPTVSWRHPLPDEAGDSFAIHDGMLTTSGTGIQHWRLPQESMGHLLPREHGFTSADWSDTDELLMGLGSNVERLSVSRRQTWSGADCDPVKDVVWQGSRGVVLCAGTGTTMFTLDDAGLAPLVYRNGAFMSGPTLVRTADNAVWGTAYGPITFRLAQHTHHIERYNTLTVIRDLAPATNGQMWMATGAGALMADDVSSTDASMDVIGLASAVSSNAAGDEVLVATGTTLYRHTGITESWSVEADTTITSITWSADGLWAIAGRLDGWTEVRHANDGSLYALLPGHAERVSDVEVSTDGERLITVSWDKSARLWDLTQMTTPATHQDISERWGPTE